MGSYPGPWARCRRTLLPPHLVIAALPHQPYILLPALRKSSSSPGSSLASLSALLVVSSSTGSSLTGSCSFLNRAALIRILGRLIGSRLVNISRLANPAEIRRFNSFLIAPFACFFAGAVIRIDSSGGGDDRGGSGY
jgi:hypothetical protein